MKVTGRASDLLGRTDSASAGVIGQPEFEFRPISRPGELVNSKLYFIYFYKARGSLPFYSLSTLTITNLSATKCLEKSSET